MQRPIALREAPDSSSKEVKTKYVTHKTAQGHFTMSPVSGYLPGLTAFFKRPEVKAAMKRYPAEGPAMPRSRRSEIGASGSISRNP